MIITDNRYKVLYVDSSVIRRDYTKSQLRGAERDVAIEYADPFKAVGRLKAPESLDAVTAHYISGGRDRANFEIVEKIAKEKNIHLIYLVGKNSSVVIPREIISTGNVMMFSDPLNFAIELKRVLDELSGKNSSAEKPLTTSEIRDRINALQNRKK